MFLLRPNYRVSSVSVDDLDEVIYLPGICPMDRTEVGSTTGNTESGHLVQVSYQILPVTAGVKSKSRFTLSHAVRWFYSCENLKK